VRWGVAGNIVAAWLLTLPAAGASGAAVYGVTRIFGRGAVGPIVVLLAGVAALAVAAIRVTSKRRIPEAVPR
jgi:PiT family inorganic phosphate transporter